MTNEIEISKEKNLEKRSRVIDIIIKNKVDWYDRFLSFVIKGNFDPRLKKQIDLTGLLKNVCKKRKEQLKKSVGFRMTERDIGASKRFLLIKIMKKQITINDLFEYIEEQKNA